MPSDLGRPLFESSTSQELARNRRTKRPPNAVNPGSVPPVSLLQHVWDPTWTSDGSHIVMIGSNDLDWLGVLVVDAETGELTALQAERVGIREIAATR
jgi:hypothetical protein